MDTDWLNGCNVSPAGHWRRNTLPRNHMIFMGSKWLPDTTPLTKKFLRGIDCLLPRHHARGSRPRGRRNAEPRTIPI